MVISKPGRRGGRRPRRGKRCVRDEGANNSRNVASPSFYNCFWAHGVFSEVGWYAMGITPWHMLRGMFLLMARAGIIRKWFGPWNCHRIL